MTKTNEIILFDSNDYNSEDYYDGEFVVDELQYVLDESTNAPRGEVIGWALQSFRTSSYGAICNNGETGYVDLKNKNLSRGLLNLAANFDRMVAQDNSGELEVVYYDHDGEHTCSVRSIPKSKAAEYGRFEDESHVEKLAFVKKLSTLKTKKSFLKLMENN